MSKAPFFAGLLLTLMPMTLMPTWAQAQAIDLSHGGPVQVNAAGGIDWQQDAQVVIAHGDARAVRGDVTVTADQLIAHYRKKAAAAGIAPAAGPAATAAPAVIPGSLATGAVAAPGAADQAKGVDTTDGTSGNEVYRLEAVGHVHIFTPTDQAWGDHAVYDMDQSVLVLTGHGLRLLTPQDLLTAKDSMEYWPQKHMAVARGNAVVVTNDARRMAGDVLVAYTNPGQPQPTPPPAPPADATAPADAPPPAAAVLVPAKPPADPVMASGKLQKVEAYGDVDVRTITDTVYGDRGVYVPDTGRAKVVGHVRITHGQNQLNGAAADINMHTGLASLISGPAARVQGLIVPSDAQQGASPAKSGKESK